MDISVDVLADVVGVAQRDGRRLDERVERLEDSRRQGKLHHTYLAGQVLAPGHLAKENGV